MIACAWQSPASWGNEQNSFGSRIGLKAIKLPEEDFGTKVLICRKWTFWLKLDRRRKPFKARNCRFGTLPYYSRTNVANIGFRYQKYQGSFAESWGDLKKSSGLPDCRANLNLPYGRQSCFCVRGHQAGLNCPASDLIVLHDNRPSCGLARV